MESSRVLALNEIIGEDVASVLVKISGLKRSWIEVKAWHNVAGSEFLKRAQERLLVKV